jgi:hypothetical protein
MLLVCYAADVPVFKLLPHSVGETVDTAVQGIVASVLPGSCC